MISCGFGSRLPRKIGAGDEETGMRAAERANVIHSDPN